MKKTSRRLPWVLAGVLLFSDCAAIGSKLGGMIRENFVDPASRSLSPADCRDGVWEGIGRGYRGNILVRVTVTGGLIRNIEIAEHDEDSAVGWEAMMDILEQALPYGPAGLDTVSGATESSQGFLAALEDALRQGRIYQ
jgi:uncharacterized protein with FMN-binding domain